MWNHFGWPFTMQHCFTSVRCAKPIVEAQQGGDQVIAVLRSVLHRQPSTITASASNDCIAPWAGAARLVLRPRVRVLCSVHAHGSWHKQSQLSADTSTLVYPTLSEETIKYGTKGQTFLSAVRWRRFRVSLIFLWNDLFLSFHLTTIGIMVFIGCVDFINLWWLILCYSFDNFFKFLS